MAEHTELRAAVAVDMARVDRLEAAGLRAAAAKLRGECAPILALLDEVERLRGVEARYNWVIDPENGFFDVGSWQLGADIVDAFVAGALADPVLAANHRAKVAAARAGAGGSSADARTGGAG